MGILKRNRMGECTMVLRDPREEPVPRTCEHTKESTAFIKCSILLNLFSNYYFN